MKKSLLLPVTVLAAGALLVPVGAYGANTLHTLTGAPVTSLSPGAAYAAGTRNGFSADWSFTTHTSFLWHRDTGLQWLTDYDGSDCSTSGQFLAVNDLGMTAGAVKDDSMRLPVYNSEFAPPKREVKRYAAYEEEEEKGLPIYHAAVWRDGKTYILDGGLDPISSYSDETDGTYAVAISADGTFVIGENRIGYYPVGIMGWQYDAEADDYLFVSFATPAGASGATLKGISPDATTVYGEVMEPGMYGSIRHPAIWTDPSTCIQIQIPDAAKYEMGSGLAAWSADGTKVLVYGSGYTSWYLGIYDTVEQTLTDIPLPQGIYGVDAFALTDSGNIFLALTDSSWTTTNYYYDAATSTFITMAEYLAECAPDISTAASLARDAKVKAVSGDGAVIVFNTVSYTGEAGASMVLDLDNPAVSSIPAPDRTEFYHSSPSEVTFRWEGVSVIPDGLALRGYEVYIDGLLAETVEATAAGGEFSVKADADAGSPHSAYIRTLFTKGGEERTSAPSKALVTYVSANTSLLGFDNFDDCLLDAMGNPYYAADDWYSHTPIPNPLVISWALSVRDWDNNNPFAEMTSTAETPWACAYTSRYHDASDVAASDELFLSFYAMSKEANVLGQDRSTDFLDIEYSTDGREWHLLRSICAADMEHAKWSFFKVDIAPEVAGKVFQLRFNAHGEGQAMLLWALDCIGINDGLDGDTPEGVRIVSASDEGVTLTWQNTMKAWDASHLINSYVEADAAAANSGDPIMLAVDMRPADLAHHVGEYISGVSAFLYDMPGQLSDGTRAEAVVYADGREVARTEFVGPFEAVNSSTAWLPRPVQIEAGVTYRLAVNLIRYDATYPPLYYQNVAECLPGVTDLFSEDDGQTWLSMHDEYERIYAGADKASQRALGNCIWSIHADITADPADVSKEQKDEEIIGYNVFRDGEQINPMVVYAPYMKFTDPDPLPEASYAVQAFYRDGRVSPISEPCFYEAAGVEGVWGEAPAVSVEPGRVSIAGAFDRAELFALGGMRVASAGANGSIATSALPHGVYLFRIKAGSRTDVMKIMIN